MQDFVRTHYGRTLSVGEIHFNPFTLALEVRRLSLADADGQTLLAFERLYVNLQLASLWRLAPSFGAIVLEQPYVRALVRPGGALNLSDLGKGFPVQPAKAQPKSAPPRLFIGPLTVASGTVSFEDRTRRTPFRRLDLALRQDGRVFIVNVPRKPDSGDTVKAELAVG